MVAVVERQAVVPERRAPPLLLLCPPLSRMAAAAAEGRVTSADAVFNAALDKVQIILEVRRTSRSFR